MLRPLAGLKVIEFEGIGPGPLAGRMLADHGADVTAIVRPDKAAIGNPAPAGGDDPLRRGKRVVALDLKRPEAVAEALALIAAADALIEGNRPGVMERLGPRPADCARRNPKLVYGRMTGWGQDGPLAQAAGHDLNYVALTGALSLTERPGAAPIVPPTVLGDAGGALGLAFGIVSGVLSARATGPGRVVDAAILDIVAALSGIALWARATRMLDGGGPSIFHDSPFYDAYRLRRRPLRHARRARAAVLCALLDKLGLADVDPKAQYDMRQWPALKARFRELFASRPSGDWRALLEGTDVCFAPGAELRGGGGPSAQRGARPLSRGPGGRLEAAAAPRFQPLNPSPGAERRRQGDRCPPAPPAHARVPVPAPPAPGEVLEVRPGIFWARLALPFRLDHVNLYLVEDGAGLALIDTGIDNPPSRAAWEALIDGPLEGRRLTRLIATHFHPDHIGLAGWLCERFDMPLAMSQTEYLLGSQHPPRPVGAEVGALQRLLPFARADRRSTEILLGNGLQYLRMVAPPPKTFQRLMADDRVTIGGRRSRS